MPIIEEKAADELGTGMENIKVLLAAPKQSTKLVEKEETAKRVIEIKELYRPLH